MRGSSTLQAILEESRQEGMIEGRIEMTRRIPRGPYG
jgi:hypothetical protein